MQLAVHGQSVFTGQQSRKGNTVTVVKLVHTVVADAAVRASWRLVDMACMAELGLDVLAPNVDNSFERRERVVTCFLFFFFCCFLVYQVQITGTDTKVPRAHAGVYRGR